MRRVVLVFALGVGMLAMGVTNASAARYCSVDPTVGIGLPIHTSVNVTTQLLGTSSHIYASNNSSSTTFGGVVGLP
ncbi:MAG: hypothetical protein E6I95_03560 [Chloroflexi bacterium]|jgi:hypothetical protein|nr:MAG: hypothetical protein E6I95_03560 [Chloroflexota bacterium]